jgi:hypothetical protein
VVDGAAAPGAFDEQAASDVAASPAANACVNRLLLII